jgi:hypothetical protein
VIYDTNAWFFSLLLNENLNIRSLEVLDLTQTSITAQLLASTVAKNRPWTTLKSLSLTKYSNEEDFGAALKTVGQVRIGFEIEFCVGVS